MHTAPDFFLIIRLHGSLRARQQNHKMAAIHDFFRRTPCNAAQLFAQSTVLYHQKPPRFQPERAGRQARKFEECGEVFVADVAVRAARRYKENIERGMTDQSLAEIEADIEARDLYDSTREHSPLKQAEDAILVDTSHETLDSLLAKLTEMIQKRM